MMTREELVTLRRQLISMRRIASKALPQVERMIAETPPTKKPGRERVGKRVRGGSNV